MSVMTEHWADSLTYEAFHWINVPAISAHSRKRFLNGSVLLYPILTLALLRMNNCHAKPVGGSSLEPVESARARHPTAPRQHGSRRATRQLPGSVAGVIVTRYNWTDNAPASRSRKDSRPSPTHRNRLGLPTRLAVPIYVTSRNAAGRSDR